MKYSEFNNWRQQSYKQLHNILQETVPIYLLMHYSYTVHGIKMFMVQVINEVKSVSIPFVLKL